MYIARAEIAMNLILGCEVEQRILHLVSVAGLPLIGSCRSLRKRCGEHGASWWGLLWGVFLGTESMRHFLVSVLTLTALRQLSVVRCLEEHQVPSDRVNSSLKGEAQLAKRLTANGKPDRIPSLLEREIQR